MFYFCLPNTQTFLKLPESGFPQIFADETADLRRGRSVWISLVAQMTE